MSRYIILPATEQTATHRMVSPVGTTFHHIVDTDGKQVQSKQPRVDSIDGYEAIPVVVKPVPVPRSVPLWAFRQTLADDGLLSTILTAAAGNASVVNFLEYGNFVSRDSAALAAIATQLGKTGAEVDDLFRRAARLKL